jgi:hypothetical protein
MSIFRPLPAFLSAFLLFVAWTWIGMAGIDYDGALRPSSFTTAGWFVLGFPVIGGIALAYAAFASFLIRKRCWITACAIFAVLVMLIGMTAYGSLPANRVAAIIGPDLARNVTIHRLHAMDSFNAGVTTFGVISGPEDLLHSIAEEQSLRLEETVTLYRFQFMFPEDSLPDYGPVYTDGRLTFYSCADTNRIYFKNGP